MMYRYLAIKKLMTVYSRRLKNVWKIGILCSFAKCIIKTKCCSFGNQYTPEGVKSDDKEVAIKQDAATHKSTTEVYF